MLWLSLFILALLVVAAQAQILQHAEILAKQLEFAGPDCQYNGVDYSGLSSLSDISFHVSNPCGFPLGSFTYFVSFCRPISRNSSEACNAVGASVCAIQEETGKIIVMAYYTGKSQIKPIQGNSTLGITIQGENQEDGQKAFINLYCSLSEVPGSPRAEYSPWLPNYFTSTVQNSVGSDGQCSAVEFGFSLACTCPGSGGCQNPLPSFPVDASINDLLPVEVACAGPNGSIFSSTAFNLTIHQSIPDGRGGYSSVPYASSPHFFTQAACVWSPYDEALYYGVMVHNTTGSLILRVQKNLVEEFAWFDDFAYIESLDFYDDSLYISLSSRNYTLSNTIYRYPVKGNKSPVHLYHNVQMEGFGSIYINPFTGILYAIYPLGYYSLNLKTLALENFPLGDQILNMAFSNNPGPYGNGTVYSQTTAMLSNTPFPSCQFNEMNPATGKMKVLSIMAECGVVLTFEFFMDSNNRLWATNWGRIFRLSTKVDDKGEENGKSALSMEFLEK